MLRQGPVAHGLLGHGSSGAAVAETIASRKGGTAAVPRVQHWKGSDYCFWTQGMGIFLIQSLWFTREVVRRKLGACGWKGGAFLLLELQAGIMQCTVHLPTVTPVSPKAGTGAAIRLHVCLKEMAALVTLVTKCDPQWVPTAKQGQGVLRKREQKTLNMSRWEKSLWEQKFDPKKISWLGPRGTLSLDCPC